MINAVYSQGLGGRRFQLSYSHDGKSHTEYVQKEDVPALTQELENYRKLRGLLTGWVELEIELAGIRRKGSGLENTPIGVDLCL